MESVLSSPRWRLQWTHPAPRTLQVLSRTMHSRLFQPSCLPMVSKPATLRGGQAKHLPRSTSTHPTGNEARPSEGANPISARISAKLQNLGKLSFFSPLGLARHGPAPLPPPRPRVSSPSARLYIEEHVITSSGPKAWHGSLTHSRYSSGAIRVLPTSGDRGQRRFNRMLGNGLRAGVPAPADPGHPLPESSCQALGPWKVATVVALGLGEVRLYTLPLHHDPRFPRHQLASSSRGTS